MFMTKALKITALTGLVLAATFSTALADHGYRHSGKKHFKHGKPECQQIVQVVKVGDDLLLKDYGKACAHSSGKHYIASHHEHPNRYGDELYIWEHGELVAFHDDYYHAPKKRYSSKFKRNGHFRTVGFYHPYKKYKSSKFKHKGHFKKSGIHYKHKPYTSKFKHKGHFKKSGGHYGGYYGGHHKKRYKQAYHKRGSFKGGFKRGFHHRY